MTRRWHDVNGTGQKERQKKKKKKFKLKSTISQVTKKWRIPITSYLFKSKHKSVSYRGDHEDI